MGNDIRCEKDFAICLGGPVHIPLRTRGKQVMGLGMQLMCWPIHTLPLIRSADTDMQYICEKCVHDADSAKRSCQWCGNS